MSSSIFLAMTDPLDGSRSIDLLIYHKKSTIHVGKYTSSRKSYGFTNSQDLFRQNLFAKEDDNRKSKKHVFLPFMYR